MHPRRFRDPPCTVGCAPWEADLQHNRRGATPVLPRIRVRQWAELRPASTSPWIPTTKRTGAPDSRCVPTWVRVKEAPMPQKSAGRMEARYGFTKTAYAATCLCQYYKGSRNKCITFLLQCMLQRIFEGN